MDEVGILTANATEEHALFSSLAKLILEKNVVFQGLYEDVDSDLHRYG